MRHAPLARLGCQVGPGFAGQVAIPQAEVGLVLEGHIVGWKGPGPPLGGQVVIAGQGPEHQVRRAGAAVVGQRALRRRRPAAGARLARVLHVQRQRWARAVLQQPVHHRLHPVAGLVGRLRQVGAIFRPAQGQGMAVLARDRAVRPPEGRGGAERAVAPARGHGAQTMRRHPIDERRVGPARPVARTPGAGLQVLGQGVDLRDALGRALDAAVGGQIAQRHPGRGPVAQLGVGIVAQVEMQKTPVALVMPQHPQLVRRPLLEPGLRQVAPVTAPVPRLAVGKAPVAVKEAAGDPVRRVAVVVDEQRIGKLRLQKGEVAKGLDLGQMRPVPALQPGHPHQPRPAVERAGALRGVPGDIGGQIARAVMPPAQPRRLKDIAEPGAATAVEPDQEDARNLALAHWRPAPGLPVPEPSQRARKCQGRTGAILWGHCLLSPARINTKLTVPGPRPGEDHRFRGRAHDGSFHGQPPVLRRQPGRAARPARRLCRSGLPRPAVQFQCQRRRAGKGGG